ncbi:MAG: hypothetical protein Q8P41_19460 [Pseudomonadota bacterium]|nr:hypothetical protein [Pseudomonadota bacterium]
MSAKNWLLHVRSINPLAERLYESGSREAFLDASERLLERVVQRMEGSRSTYRKLDEPDLSKLIVELLGELVPCESEAHQNGHVDVTIRHPRGKGFRHITECKIWNGGRWHRAGMQQLLGYATGREGRAMSLAFFVRHKRMVFLMDRLRRQLGPANDPVLLGEAEDHVAIPGAFVTRHEHASGSTLRIVHLGCSLWEEGVEDLGEDED